MYYQDKPNENMVIKSMFRYKRATITANISPSPTKNVIMSILPFHKSRIFLSVIIGFCNFCALEQKDIQNGDISTKIQKSLKSSNVDIPKWDKIKKFTKSRKNNIHLCYGKDKTGNLYNLDNIIHFKNYI